MIKTRKLHIFPGGVCNLNHITKILIERLLKAFHILVTTFFPTDKNNIIAFHG